MHTRLAFLLVSLALVIPSILPVVAQADPIGSDAFQRTWARTDQPVSEGRIDRTWMWGPEPFTDAIPESYEQSPGGSRTVQYFDKSRMELTYPDIDPSSPWAVTNGLLVVELVTGNLQLGDATFEQHYPAQLNIAGDPDDPSGPSYATFGMLLDDPPLADATVITQRVDRAGDITADASLAQWGVQAGPLVPETQHRVASVFWDFLHSSGTVYVDDQYVDDALFDPWYYASGLPITEAYWTTVKVGGTPHDVLVQAFERRVLTYTPQNPPGWQVEAGNVGQHYYTWRYTVLPNEEPADVVISDCSDGAAVEATLEAGGRIRFDCGETTLDLGAEVTIDSDTTIDGAGVTTLSGGGNHRVLAIAAPALYTSVNVTLRGLTIADGWADSGGGIAANGVYNRSVTLTLDRVALRDNEAVTDGGALYGDGNHYGGVTVSAVDSTFTGNFALGSGGAIYANGNYGSVRLSVADSRFEGNAANGSGGAVFSDGTSDGTASLIATGTTFSRNTASAGGAIVSTGAGGSATLTLTDATFTGNTANIGGAIYNEGVSGGKATVTATGVRFESNSALKSGGAIYSDDGMYGQTRLDFTDTTLSDNWAYNGGAIMSSCPNGEQGRSEMTATDTTFSNNGAHNSGGAIYSGGDPENFFNACDNANLTIANSAFTGNAAQSSGGAVYSSGGAVLAATNATFSGNTADTGGAIRCDAPGSSVVTLTVTSTLFWDNWGTAISCGGGDYYFTVTVTATNVTFSDNPDGAVDLFSSKFHNTTFIATNVTFAGSSVLAGVFANVMLASSVFDNSRCIIDYHPLPPGSASAISLGHNIADDESCGLTQPTDLPNTDPLLGPLQDNGGPTLTHALLPGSPAIDSGDPAACPATDQRSVARPQDGDGDGVAICDRGAVEMTPPSEAGGGSP